MGMTIDTAIIQATLLKDGISKDKYKYEILTTLIDTVKKYQKIEQIVDRHTGNNAEEKAYNYMMIVKDIKEVLEDRNVD